MYVQIKLRPLRVLNGCSAHSSPRGRLEILNDVRARVAPLVSIADLPLKDHVHCLEGTFSASTRTTRLSVNVNVLCSAGWCVSPDVAD